MTTLRPFGLWVAIVATLAVPISVEAQTTPPVTPAVTAAQRPIPASRRLRVFLDCGECFSEYLRSEIDWVDFVRQAQDADVHLLANSRETGGGGREIALRFVGVGRFQSVDRELRAVSLSDDPEDLRRRGVRDTVTIGFLGYMASEGLPPGWDVSVETGSAERGAAGPARDPWNLWVFSVRAGGSFEAEESNRQLEWESSVSADRVTEQWKVSFGASIDERTERFDLDEDEPAFEVTRGNRSASGGFAKSLGPHWSVGAESRVSASDFGNTKFSAILTPAVEYSIFPYREYASRLLFLTYKAGVERLKYNEVTIFDKLSETLWRHELELNFEQEQPWGSVQVGVGFSQYLSDPSKYRIEGDGELSVRLFRGLSVNLDGSASRIRDQLSLPKRDASPEEVLLRLRQLQSGYQMDFSINLTYSFGSRFNNVVNPRFGG